jgi:hypothetical protein
LQTVLSLNYLQPRHLALVGGIAAMSGLISIPGQIRLSVVPVDLRRGSMVCRHWSSKPWDSNIRKYGGKLLIKPAKKNVQAFLRKTRQIKDIKNRILEES